MSKKKYIIYVSKEGFMKFHQLRFSEKFVASKNTQEVFDIIVNYYINNHE